MGAAICQSYLWQRMKVHFLTENQHFIESSENADFAQFLPDVGSGIPNHTHADGSTVGNKMFTMFGTWAKMHLYLRKYK